MPDINLLPENFREKERKELDKAAKRPKVFEVAMSQAEKDKLAKTSDKPNKSFWQKIFGSTPKTAKPTLPKSASFGHTPSVDLLASAKKEKIHFGPVVHPESKKQKNSFWSRFFGPANSPIKSTIEVKQNWPPARPSFEMPHVRKEKTEEKIPKPLKIKKEKSNWLAGIFAQKSRKPKIERPEPVLVKEEKEEKIKEKKIKPAKRNFGFNLAPKGKKSAMDINLMPKELLTIRHASPREQFWGLLAAMMLPAILIFGLFYFFGFLQKQTDAKIMAYQNKADQLQKEINVFEEAQNRDTLLKQKLVALKDLLDKHIYFTKFFNLLQKYTLDDVHFTDLTMDTSGEFVLPAVASSYEKAAQQIVAFRQATDFIKSVEAKDIKLYSEEKAGIVGVSFELKITLVDNIFRQIKK